MLSSESPLSTARPLGLVVDRGLVSRRRPRPAAAPGQRTAHAPCRNWSLTRRSAAAAAATTTVRWVGRGRIEEQVVSQGADRPMEAG